jgi:hypothetical protein
MDTFVRSGHLKTYLSQQKYLQATFGFQMYKLNLQKPSLLLFQEARTGWKIVFSVCVKKVWYKGDLLCLLKTKYSVQQILSAWPQSREKQSHGAQIKEERIKELYRSLITQPGWLSNSDGRN